MSASSKKKLRHEQEAAKLTERQLNEQKEAKKLNLYTTAFVAVLVVLLVVALTVGISSTVKSSGLRERSTTAVTIGSHELSNAQLSYFYIDGINTFLRNYGSYASMFGLDVTKPLDQQILDEESGKTWADDFLDAAVENARSVYAMVDAANAEGFTLTDAQQSNVTATLSNLSAYATLYGYSSADDYVKAMYGYGTNLESYTEYVTNSMLADAYYSNYANSLTYEDADIAAADAEDPKANTSYSYNYYYLAANKFLEGGTEGEDGVITYSDEEKAASVKAAEEAATSLVAEEVDSVKELDIAINGLSINAGAETKASSTACDDYLYASVMGTLSDWVTDESRKDGDMTVIPSTTTSTAGDGTETTTTNGYYVVYFRGSNDNEFALANVRHILVSFEGGTTDESTGTTTYSEEAKKAAWTAAEEILNTWKSGEATEDSFAALAAEKTTDPSSKENGGLYEDVYPGQMVEPFETWCFDSRKAGDTGIVETSYGVHVMYYVGDSDTTYRDHLITNKLISADTAEWYNGLIEATTVTEGSTKYMNTALVLSNN